MSHVKKLIILVVVILCVFLSFSAFKYYSTPKVNLEYLTNHSFSVSGMTCQSCSQKINAFLERQLGIVAVDSDHVSGKVTVSYDASQVSTGQIRVYIKTLGYVVNSNSDVKVIDYSIQYN